MKYIIFLLLISGFVACDKNSTSSRGDQALGGGSTTIFNASDMLLRIKKGGDDGDDSNSQVLALRTDECVALTAGELAVLTVEEDDVAFGLDDILCSNMNANETPCGSGDKVVLEAEDRNGYVLVDAPRPNENCKSIHGVVTAREEAADDK